MTIMTAHAMVQKAITPKIAFTSDLLGRSIRYAEMHRHAQVPIKHTHV